MKSLRDRLEDMKRVCPLLHLVCSEDIRNAAIDEVIEVLKEYML